MVNRELIEIHNDIREIRAEQNKARDRDIDMAVNIAKLQKNWKISGAMFGGFSTIVILIIKHLIF